MKHKSLVFGSEENMQYGLRGSTYCIRERADGPSMIFHSGTERYCIDGKGVFVEISKTGIIEVYDPSPASVWRKL